MSRRKGEQKPRNCDVGGFFGEVYWGSYDYNRRLYHAYRNQIIELALTRFEWVGLPDTVDAMALERTLLYKGMATIARNGTIWYGLPMSTIGKPNVYQEPRRWYAQSNTDAGRFMCSPANGVVVYDSPTLNPKGNFIDLFARELVDVHKTQQMNRMHQKVPYMVVAPDEMELTAINLVKQIFGGEPAIVGRPTLRDIEIDKVDLSVPYLGEQLSIQEANLWNRIYTFLGISSVTFKAERMIEDEVSNLSEPATLTALSGLVMRRRAAEKLNKRFGLDVQCVWRADNESENYNLVHNLKKLGNLYAGDTKGVGEVMDNGQAGNTELD